MALVLVALVALVARRSCCLLLSLLVALVARSSCCSLLLSRVVSGNLLFRLFVHPVESRGVLIPLRFFSHVFNS